MIDVTEELAGDLLELSSEQRLNILNNLSEKKSKLTALAKQLDATTPEVFRNLERLTKAHLITKESDGYYNLAPYGKAVLSIIPTISFISKNKKYFRDHSFGNLPQKFIQRIGGFKEVELLNGFSKIMEQWKSIFRNSESYINGILYEEPLDLIDPIIKKAKKGVKINSIFSDLAIIPKGRKEILEKLGFSNLVEQKIIERKMKKDVQIIVVLNEKEASVLFPKINGEVDMSKMFYSKNDQFHEWCLDYFRYCWYGSDFFQERKLKE